MTTLAAQAADGPGEAVLRRLRDQRAATPVVAAPQEALEGHPVAADAPRHGVAASTAVGAHRRIQGAARGPALVDARRRHAAHPAARIAAGAQGLHSGLQLCNM
mmetsp:Transcript_78959/g.219558  ORF Transcript_78959/g.219558 Transcript_78959/m.219558 type:complete len:104 (-) Transcript_78959:118-429(-)